MTPKQPFHWRAGVSSCQLLLDVQNFASQLFDHW